MIDPIFKCSRCAFAHAQLQVSQSSTIVAYLSKIWCFIL